MATWDDKFHNTNQIPIFFKYNKLKCGVRSYSIFYVINLAQCVKGNVSPFGPAAIALWGPVALTLPIIKRS